MRNSLFLFLFGLIISLSSCRNDFEFQPSKGGLTFSKDTVYLDTVFTNIGSSTYRLKVYNKSDNDISIPKIQLAKGTSSKYRMMIDGLTGEDSDASGFGEGKIFNDVELLAKDSMFIFIEVTADVASANPTDFLYTDKIEFHNISGAPQTVELVTLIQDAIFIYPNRPIDTGIKETLIINGMDSEIEGHELSTPEELNWTNEKPYVIYGFALVPNGSTLNIEEGTKVHFHANSGIIIDKFGTLKINGSINNDVVFEGDRLEPSFANTTGQWFGIANFSSNLNTIEHLIIKNASLGIYNIPYGSNFYETKLNIKNSQIYNCSNYGIFSLGGIIDGKNAVINNCGQACFAGIYGGSYNFTHCTFNNNWSSSRQVAVLLNNYYEDALPQGNSLNNANFTNCIIYGSNQIEMLLDNEQSTNATTLFNYKFNHCLLKFNNNSSSYINNPLYQFTTDTTHYVNCSIANNSTLFNPKFEDESKNLLWLSEDLNLPHDAAATALVPTDIAGINRTTSTDLGAYQYVP